MLGDRYAQVGEFTEDEKKLKRDIDQIGRGRLYIVRGNNVTTPSQSGDGSEEPVSERVFKSVAGRSSDDLMPNVVGPRPPSVANQIGNAIGNVGRAVGNFFGITRPGARTDAQQSAQFGAASRDMMNGRKVFDPRSGKLVNQTETRQYDPRTKSFYTVPASQALTRTDARMYGYDEAGNYRPLTKQEGADRLAEVVAARDSGLSRLGQPGMVRPSRHERGDQAARDYSLKRAQIGADAQRDVANAEIAMTERQAQIGREERELVRGQEAAKEYNARMTALRTAQDKINEMQAGEEKKQAQAQLDAMMKNRQFQEGGYNAASVTAKKYGMTGKHPEGDDLDTILQIEQIQEGSYSEEARSAVTALKNKYSTDARLKEGFYEHKGYIIYKAPPVRGRKGPGAVVVIAPTDMLIAPAAEGMGDEDLETMPAAPAATSVAPPATPTPAPAAGVAARPTGGVAEPATRQSTGGRPSRNKASAKSSWAPFKETIERAERINKVLKKWQNDDKTLEKNESKAKIAQFLEALKQEDPNVYNSDQLRDWTYFERKRQ